MPITKFYANIEATHHIIIDGRINFYTGDRLDVYAPLVASYPSIYTIIEEIRQK
jgi:hypothetical protein